MPKITVPMPSFEGVAAGSTATARLPIGKSFEKLLLTYGGATIAQLDEIRIVLNGQTIQRFATAGGKSGAENLDLLNQFDGMAAAAGVLVVPFNRHGLRTRMGEEVTAMGTGLTRAQAEGKAQPSTLSIEVDIAAAAVAPTLALKAHQGPRQPVGLIKKTRHFVYNAPAVGDFEISDLPKGDLINRVIFHSTAITHLKLERDNQKEFERTKAENELVQTNGKRTPVTGMFIYDPTEEGFGAESLVTKGVQDLRFTLTMSGAGAVPVTVEYLGALED